MRILFINPAPIIKHGIGPAFAELGHEAHYVFLAREKSLEPFLEDIKPQFVFTEGGASLFDLLFPLLEEAHIPHIYWAIEDPVDFHSLSLPYALKSRHIFTPCRECLPDYRKYGVEAHLLMFACLPSFHHQVEPYGAYDHDIVFVGNNYVRHPARMQGVDNILRPLVEGGYDIRIFGNEWWLDHDHPFRIKPEIYGGYLPHESFPAVCSTARIMLGLHSVDTSLTMMSMRTYEVLGCGGFYLTQWTPAIEHLFQNHYHLVWSRSPGETRELVDYYLARPRERERIARQGQQEVYDKHTYQHRVREAVKILERPVPSSPFIDQGRNIKVIRNKRIN